MTDGRPRFEGQLTLDQLRAEVERGALETVIVGFTDHYGRLMGKRYDGGRVRRRYRRPWHARVRLPADDRHGDGAGSGVPLRQLGDRATATFTSCRIWTRLCVASWLEKTALVLCDVVDDATGERSRAVAPRSILRRQLDAARELGYTALAASELEYYVFQDSYREAAGSGLSRSAAGGLVPGGLSHPAGHADRDLHGGVDAI